MARNGSGTMSIPYPDFVNGTAADADQVDANNADIVAEITNSIAADGQTTITANIPFSNYKVTGLGPGSAATDSSNLGQVQAQAYVWCGTAGGTDDAIALSPSPAITAYAAGQRFLFVAASDNTAATTISVSGLAAKSAQLDGSALAGGEIVTGKIYEIIYDGTQFQITRKSGIFDNSITTTKLADGSATLDKLDDTGTSGYVLTAQGSGVDPAWEPAGWRVIDVVTTSGSQATVEMDVNFNDYSEFKIYGNGIEHTGVPATGLSLEFQLSIDGGATWQNSSGDYKWNKVVGNYSSTSVTGDNTSTSVSVLSGIRGGQNDGASFQAMWSKTSVSDPSLLSTGQYISATNENRTQTTTASYNGGGTPDRIRFFLSSSGVFTDGCVFIAEGLQR